MQTPLETWIEFRAFVKHGNFEEPYIGRRIYRLKGNPYSLIFVTLPKSHYNVTLYCGNNVLHHATLHASETWLLTKYFLDGTSWLSMGFKEGKDKPFPFGYVSEQAFHDMQSARLIGEHLLEIISNRQDDEHRFPVYMVHCSERDT